MLDILNVVSRTVTVELDRDSEIALDLLTADGRNVQDAIRYAITMAATPYRGESPSKVADLTSDEGTGLA